MARRVDDELAPGQALAQVIVGVSFQNEGHALGYEGSEAHPCRTIEVHANRVFRKSLGTVALGNVVAKNRAHGPVDIANWQNDIDGLALLDRVFAQRHQRGYIQGFFQSMILAGGAVHAKARPRFGLMQYPGEIQSVGLPVVDGFFHVQPVHLTDHFVDRSESKPGHVFANFLRDKLEEIFHEFRLAGEFLG